MTVSRTPRRPLRGIALLACVMACAPWGPAAVAATPRDLCAGIPDLTERARCEVRQSSRERAEQEASSTAHDGIEALSGDAGTTADPDGATLSERWDEAVRDARRPDVGSLVFSREGALFIGMAWLVLAVLRERRRRNRRRGSS